MKSYTPLLVFIAVQLVASSVAESNLEPIGEESSPSRVAIIRPKNDEAMLLSESTPQAYLVHLKPKSGERSESGSDTGADTAKRNSKYLVLLRLPEDDEETAVAASKVSSRQYQQTSTERRQYQRQMKQTIYDNLEQTKDESDGFDDDYNNGNTVPPVQSTTTQRPTTTTEPPTTYRPTQNASDTSENGQTQEVYDDDIGFDDERQDPIAQQPPQRPPNAGFRPSQIKTGFVPISQSALRSPRLYGMPSRPLTEQYNNQDEMPMNNANNDDERSVPVILINMPQNQGQQLAYTGNNNRQLPSFSGARKPAQDTSNDLQSDYNRIPQPSVYFPPAPNDNQQPANKGSRPYPRSPAQSYPRTPSGTKTRPQSPPRPRPVDYDEPTEQMNGNNQQPRPMLNPSRDSGKGYTGKTPARSSKPGRGVPASPGHQQTNESRQPLKGRPLQMFQQQMSNQEPSIPAPINQIVDTRGGQQSRKMLKNRSKYYNYSINGMDLQINNRTMNVTGNTDQHMKEMDQPINNNMNGMNQNMNGVNGMDQNVYGMDQQINDNGQINGMGNQMNGMGGNQRNGFGDQMNGLGSNQMNGKGNQMNAMGNQMNEMDHQTNDMDDGMSDQMTGGSYYDRKVKKLFGRQSQTPMNGMLNPPQPVNGDPSGQQMDSNEPDSDENGNQQGVYNQKPWSQQNPGSVKGGRQPVPRPPIQASSPIASRPPTQGQIKGNDQRRQYPGTKNMNRPSPRPQQQIDDNQIRPLPPTMNRPQIPTGDDNLDSEAQNNNNNRPQPKPFPRPVSPPRGSVKGGDRQTYPPQTIPLMPINQRNPEVPTQQMSNQQPMMQQPRPYPPMMEQGRQQMQPPNQQMMELRSQLGTQPPTQQMMEPRPHSGMMGQSRGPNNVSDMQQSSKPMKLMRPQGLPPSPSAYYMKKYRTEQTQGNGFAQTTSQNNQQMSQNNDNVAGQQYQSMMNGYDVQQNVFNQSPFDVDEQRMTMIAQNMGEFGMRSGSRALEQAASGPMMLMLIDKDHNPHQRPALF